MKAKAIVIVNVALTAMSAFGQVPKPFFGDKGCPAKSLFANDGNISGDDFIQMHHLQSYAIAPVYSVRIYGDGRLVWHGEAKVQAIGEASGNIGVVQAKALIASRGLWMDVTSTVRSLPERSPIQSLLDA